MPLVVIDSPGVDPVREATLLPSGKHTFAGAVVLGTAVVVVELSHVTKVTTAEAPLVVMLPSDRNVAYMIDPLLNSTGCPKLPLMREMIVPDELDPSYNVR